VRSAQVRFGDTMKRRPRNSNTDPATIRFSGETRPPASALKRLRELRGSLKCAGAALDYLDRERKRDRERGR